MQTAGQSRQASRAEASGLWHRCSRSLDTSLTKSRNTPAGATHWHAGPKTVATQPPSPGEDQVRPTTGVFEGLFTVPMAEKASSRHLPEAASSCGTALAEDPRQHFDSVGGLSAPSRWRPTGDSTRQRVSASGSGGIRPVGWLQRFVWRVRGPRSAPSPLGCSASTHKYPRW